MTPSEILHQLERYEDELPREALRAAIEQRAAIVPELIHALNQVTRRPTDFISKPDHMLHTYALYLLAQLRETSALHPILRFFSLPDELAHDLTGDVITEDGARILASVCGTHLAAIQQLVEDESVDDYARGEGLETFAVLVSWGELPREQAIAIYRELFHGRLARPGNSYVWAALVGVARDLNARELMSEIRQAFDEDLVDETVIDLGFIEEWCFDPNQDPFVEFAAAHPKIVDAVEEFEGWASFNEETSEADDLEHESEPDELDDWLEPEVQLPGLFGADGPPVPSPEPYLAPSKPGRNDPCPCGSGQKFKKCCGNKS